MGGGVCWVGDLLLWLGSPEGKVSRGGALRAKRRLLYDFRRLKEKAAGSWSASDEKRGCPRKPANFLGGREASLYHCKKGRGQKTFLLPISRRGGGSISGTRDLKWCREKKVRREGEDRTISEERRKWGFYFAVNYKGKGERKNSFAIPRGGGGSFNLCGLNSETERRGSYEENSADGVLFFFGGEEPFLLNCRKRKKSVFGTW